MPCVACTVFWLLLLITWCNSRIVLIFMKPKGCYTSIVKDYAYRHWKENVPNKSFLLLKQSVTSIHCVLSLEGFWTNPLVFVGGPNLTSNQTQSSRSSSPWTVIMISHSPHTFRCHLSFRHVNC